jgi:hypothetical protein
LWWFEYNDAGTPTRKAIKITNGKFYKMDDLDKTWDDITGYITITSGNYCDFENFLNNVYVTNGVNKPFMWATGATANEMTVPAGLTTAKFVKQFNNYLFLGNVAVGGTDMPSRVYWSNIKDTGTWEGDQFIEISKDDGTEITGLKVLQDRLVVYKHKAIYNLFFTGDADFPFIMPSGGKSNSTVGCVSPYSIQEIENGHVFLAADGIYYYDGANSYKLSYKIQETLDGYNATRFTQAVSSIYKPKNKYYLALPAASSTDNDRIIVWDYFNNAFSIYTGFAPSALCTFFVDGIVEQPYFCDYSGFDYRMDFGSSDYPLNVKTAINAYYYTNWKTYEDLCDQKGIANVYIYYQSSNSVLSFAYSYDFEDEDQYTQTVSLSTGTDVYGTGVYGTATYSGSGGAVIRRDITSRGRTVRFKFANSVIDESFQIDGFGTLVHLETNV